MSYQIKNLQGDILFEAKGYSLKAVVKLAVKQGANLYRANLKGANLEGANLYRANLEGANLEGANLYRANLEGAYLEGAYLEGANLEGANLYRANLEGAYLYRANLEVANLEGAYLEGANLEGAYLKGANLKGANLPNFLILPSEGSFIAYKKLSCDVIVKVLIPEDAQRTNSLIGRKCRASKVEVLSIVQGNIPEGVKIKSTNYGDAVYAVGEVVEAGSFDLDIRVECTHGIHFFMTLKEAEEWS